MKKVTVHFHNTDELVQEQAFLFGDNILLSDYDGILYFRVVTVGFRQEDNFHLRDYKTVELPYKVSAELTEEMSLLDYIALAAK
ncbi:hypothetical protein ACFQWC_14295 [Rossellomorea sp. GCM10028870]|uniref:hypothetical protein n=1 Tax=Rossellomorea sp. GCM10028870 TaxID=3273426 RepID=UPI00361880E5